MRADDLILFYQVIELGSFSKVAEQNGLTNSVVSKRLARLEEELGVQLLYRTTRKLTLTEAGKALLHGAKNVKQATQEALDAEVGQKRQRSHQNVGADHLGGLDFGRCGRRVL